MTEIPEHLLRRSRDRRAALGDGGADSGSEAPGDGDAAASPAVPAAAVAATGGAVAVPATEPEAAPPVVLPRPVQAALRRKRLPTYVVGALAVLPFWALLYAGAMTVPPRTITDPQLIEGKALYESQCAGCHGQDGGGGQGRAISGGEVLKTFPVGERDAHIEWVAIGTEGVGQGNGYGDADREGGQRVAGSYNGSNMPAFGETLTEEEILAVVRYEREILEEQTPEQLLADNGGVMPEGGGSGGGSGADH